MNELKKMLLEKKIMKIKYLFYYITGLRGGHIAYLKRKEIFDLFGEKVTFQTWKLPNEPRLIKIHDNVKIAADVTFYTHDVINSVFANMDCIPYQTHGNCIEIFDNCFIGGRSIIVGNIKIGPNAIVAAGSVVTKDVQPGTIVGGNPAVCIGSFNDLHEKRKEIDSDKNIVDPNTRSEKLWEVFYDMKDRKNRVPAENRSGFIS